MPANNRSMPPWRSRSMSSMESAPATIPATSAGTLIGALTPPVALSVSFSATRSPSRHDCASATTGASPATDTRFGSSNVADNADEPWDSRIQRMPFCADDMGLRQATSFLVRGAFVLSDAQSHAYSTVDRGSGAPTPARPGSVRGRTAAVGTPSATGLDSAARRRSGDGYVLVDGRNRRLSRGGLRLPGGRGRPGRSRPGQVAGSIWRTFSAG